MFGKENGSQKLESTSYWTSVCSTISVVAFLVCQSQSSEASGNWEILLQFCLDNK
jgi:hypothetical protein